MFKKKKQPQKSQVQAYFDKQKRLSRWFAGVAFVGFTGLFGANYVADEIRGSRYQAKFFHELANDFSYKLSDQETDKRVIAPEGPYNQRLGYTRIEEFKKSFEKHNFKMQTCAVGENINYRGIPIFPVYDEKTQAGFTINDMHGKTISDKKYPEQIYDDFVDIPDFAVQALLFVENRELLNPDNPPTQNPAIEWDRFAGAVFDRALKETGLGEGGAGGSGLATQLEKLNHSKNGVTYSPKDKLTQMLTASARSYQAGYDTTQARYEIVADYINSMPLAGRGAGEIIGLKSGLKAWFDVDLDSKAYLFTKNHYDLNNDEKKQVAILYRQVLSMILAVQRPTAYLKKEWDFLQERVDVFIPLLAKENIIPKSLIDLALQTEIKPSPAPEEVEEINQDKSINLLRLDLLDIFNVNQDLYKLDRYDAFAKSTIDGGLTKKVTELLNEFSNPKGDFVPNLTGHRLAKVENMDEIIYTFTLYERTNNGNVLRVQTDNYPGPFNLNEDSKIELGSTAKFRTLVTYLQIIEKQYLKNKDKDFENLKANNPLSEFVFSYLKENKEDHSLDDLLEAAMVKTYSGKTSERFYTGGGAHRFVNFQGRDSGRGAISVRESLARSVNLPFIRMMRDIVDYHIDVSVGIDEDALYNDFSDPSRANYLKTFAAEESSIFLRRAYRAYKGKSEDEIVADLLSKTGHDSRHAATIFRYFYPDKPLEEMDEFIRKWCDECHHVKHFKNTYKQHELDVMSLNDRGYILSQHPLSLWMAKQQLFNPELSWKELLNQSRQVRLTSYDWLFETKNTRRQNNVIRTQLEKKAFVHIEESWKELGFPFDKMIPSYASSIGVSGDRPAALAELMGVIQNDGLSVESTKFNQLSFAIDTPYECNFDYDVPLPKRVLSSEIAKLLKHELRNVVNEGSAVRAKKALKLSDGSYIAVGGKTGTGDNRLKTFDNRGRLLKDEATNRTATFVFTIDDDFYGSIVAYVPGAKAENHKFTSSLPVQAFTEIAPYLKPLLKRDRPLVVSLENKTGNQQKKRSVSYKL